MEEGTAVRVYRKPSIEIVRLELKLLIITVRTRKFRNRKTTFRLNLSLKIVH